MSYPWLETFETAPSAGSYTVLAGNPAIVWNETEQALDITHGRATSLIRFNQPASSNFWFEADIELISCPVYDGSGQTQRHLGVWATTGTGPIGFRFDHYDPPYDNGDWWQVYYFPTVDYANPVLLARDDAIQNGMYRLPGFFVGERHTLRFDYWGNPERPTERMFSVSIDGKPNWFLQYASSIAGNALIPGLFLYEGVFRIHSLSGGMPSAIDYTPHASTVIKEYQPLVPVKVEMGHVGGVPANRQIDMSVAQTHLNEYWDSNKPAVVRDQRLQIGVGNVHFRGKGSIVGTVKMSATPENTPMRRRVQLIEQASSEVAAEVWSTVNGEYRFDLLDVHRQWTVVAFDYKNNLRAVIADNLRAIPP